MADCIIRVDTDKDLGEKILATTIHLTLTQTELLIINRNSNRFVHKSSGKRIDLLALIEKEIRYVVYFAFQIIAV